MGALDGIRCRFQLILSFRLFAPQSCVLVGDLDVQLLSPLNNQLPLSSRNVVSDFGSILAVVHEEKFEFFWVSHEESQKSIRTKVPGLSVRSVPDIRERELSLESSPHPTVNSLRSPP